MNIQVLKQLPIGLLVAGMATVGVSFSATASATPVVKSDSAIAQIYPNQKDYRSYDKQDDRRERDEERTRRRRERDEERTRHRSDRNDDYYRRRDRDRDYYRGSDRNDDYYRRRDRDRDYYRRS